MAKNRPLKFWFWRGRVYCPPAILRSGRNVAVVQFNRNVIIPYASAQLTRRFARSSLTFNGDTGASPGNGVYLTSRQTSAGVGYSFTGLKRWTMAAQGSYSSLSTLGQSLGK